MDTQRVSCDAIWITSELFAEAQPLNVFCRQYAPAPEYSHPPELQSRHVLFRKTVYIENFDNIKMLISADDYYKLYINGSFVTSGPAPGYPHVYYYNELDVTRFFRQGQNVIAVHTFYQGLINRVWVSGDMRHGLFLSLFSDGREIAASGTDFKCAEHTGYRSGKIIAYQTQFSETIDARALEHGFMFPEFDDTGWQHASIRKYADYKLIKQPTEQLTYYSTPPAFTEYRGSTLFMDFGREMVGYLNFSATGAAGSAIAVRYGEELNPDGSVRYKMRCNCEYEDRFILSGEKDAFAPYDYKAFRYAELILPQDCTIWQDSIVFCVRHYPFKQRYSLRSGDLDITAVWQMCVDTLKYGAQEVFQDCPQREKGQYFNDGWFTAAAYTAVTGDGALMKKMIENALQSGFICTGLMAQGPCAFSQEIVESSFYTVCAAEAYYNFTGDKMFIERILPELNSVLGYFSRFARGDGLLDGVDKWCVVDWPPEHRDGYDFDLKQSADIVMGVHNAVNAFYLGAVLSYNNLAALCNAPRIDADRANKSFFEVFFRADKGIFVDAEGSTHASLHANLFPIFLRLVPKHLQGGVLNFIKTKDFTNCNVFGALPLLYVLKRFGEYELLYKLLKSSDGFLNMLAEGATATFEAFSKDKKWNTALFHSTLAGAALVFTDKDEYGNIAQGL